jgi:aspartyl-tRNA(Asn)/glutamyl-tRNA(Gln) amidotransferase subunit A
MHELSAFDLHQKFLNKELSAVEIITHTFQRIEALDPKVQSFLSLFKEQALKTAEHQDQKLARGEKVGRLAGVPVAIKDILHIKGELTTCASKFLSNYKAPFHATAVERLKDEDAIFVGKTNLDEFAMGSSTENSAFKEIKTKNPWDLNCVPGGSSGGSAACVAARLTPISLGTDTGGSVRQPASFCGIVGYKPTYGIVSRHGLVSYCSSMDVVGPFTSNVQDAALTMEIIAGHCGKDSTSLPQKQISFLKELESPPLKPLTIGVPWSFLSQLAEEPRKLFEVAIEKCKQQGATIIDVDLDILKHSLGVYYILATAEASTNLARFDGIRYGVRSPQAKTLEEVYEMSRDEGFGEEVKRRILLGTFVLSSGYKEAFYRKAQKVRTVMIRKFLEAFKRCDLIATPVTPFAAFPFGAKKDPVQMYLEDIYTIGVNLAGLPAISVPASFTKENMPMGIQFIAPHQQDPFLLQAAYQFEKLANVTHLMPEWVQ